MYSPVFFLFLKKKVVTDLNLALFVSDCTGVFGLECRDQYYVLIRSLILITWAIDGVRSTLNLFLR